MVSHRMYALPPHLLIPTANAHPRSSLSRPLTRSIRPSTTTTRYAIQRRFISTPGYTITSPRTATIVLGSLIGTCASVYAYTQYAESTAKETRNIGPLKRVHEHLVLSARNVREGRSWTILTHTFTHLTLTHLAFNMLGLWMFGKPVIMLYGVRRFLALWVGAGITGGVTSLMVEKGNNAAAGKGTLGQWGRKHEGESRYVGASSSVFGIGAAFAAAFPKGTMMIFPIVSLPWSLDPRLWVRSRVALLMRDMGSPSRCITGLRLWVLRRTVYMRRRMGCRGT
jgi:membrane associated rhomboid family serine protease